jgi:uncharacterized protein
MIKDKAIIYNDTEYMKIVNDIISNEVVQKMKLYRQHYSVSCFDHCLLVSYNLYLLCKKFNLDYVSAARAAMVHDLFLYDWRKRENGRKGLHAFTHPYTAYENAMKIMNLNPKEKDIIIKHMWPVTFFEFPRYRETLLMIYIDKYSAIIEKKVGKR